MIKKRVLIGLVFTGSIVSAQIDQGLIIVKKSLTAVQERVRELSNSLLKLREQLMQDTSVSELSLPRLEVFVADSRLKIPYNRCIDFCLGIEENTAFIKQDHTDFYKTQLTLHDSYYYVTSKVSDLAKNNAFAIEVQALLAQPRRYQAGRFDRMTLEELRKKVTITSGKTKGTFSVYEGPTYAEVRKLLADPTFNGATFQVASNYNALETVDPYQDILTQSLSSYVSDPTQGPAAALAAAPGLIQRCYFLFEGQRQLPCLLYGAGMNQVNLLHRICNTDTGVGMSPAGYVLFNGVKNAPRPHEIAQIEIGCQRATQVIFGAINGHPSNFSTQVELVTHKQLVNQVFVAAPDFGQGTNSLSPYAIAWAKIILQASYEGTLRMAMLHGSKRVVLTWVGGGAFNNDPDWVVEILENLKPMIEASGLEVILAAYGFTPKQNVNKPRLEALVTATGGVWKK